MKTNLPIFINLSTKTPVEEFRKKLENKVYLEIITIEIEGVKCEKIRNNFYKTVSIY